MECHCVPYARLPNTSQLFLDYVDHFERVESFYKAPPFDPSSYVSVARELNYSPALRADMVRILSRQNEAFGAGDLTRSNLRRLGEPGTLAVVTGQQVGFFSGPAFTLYKALTAVRLAERLSEQGLPSVPVFWLATEDHDLEEVAATAVLDDDYNLVALRDTGVRPAPHSSVGYVQLSAAVTEALDALGATLPTGDARDRLLNDLRESYQPGATWGQAFAKFMARVFSPWGVILLDALDPEIHHLAAPLYTKAVVEAQDLNARLVQRSHALVAASYHAQVHVGPDSSLLFMAEEGNRVALRLADGGRRFKLDEGDPFSADEARRRTEAHPGDITPNALFRPVVQDCLLPTVAYIAGPAELAYHAQSAVLYPRFERPQPVIFPRASFTLVDPRSDRLLRKYNLKVDDVWQDGASLEQKIAATGFSEGWQERLDQSERDIKLVMDRLQQDIQLIDPTLLDSLKDARERTLHQFDRLKGKVTRAAFAKSEILGRHEKALTSFLMPGGELQERGVSGVYFLGRAGYELLEQLLAAIPLELARHQIMPLHHGAE
ncbi:MAG TPA: bacillithiol biosynthesis cysteine-adding enzyme BshC [Terriglobia bacterium]|nr:bacillithiol biosynthesis cysteine-adding enzyme BshC [Terriglobia bacterium]